VSEKEMIKKAKHLGKKQQAQDKNQQCLLF
jgi:hypothetical protein